jgi:hypothetical protein
VLVLVEVQRTSELKLALYAIATGLIIIQAESLNTFGQICLIGRNGYIEACPYNPRRKHCEATPSGIPYFDRTNDRPGRVFRVQCEGQWQGKGRFGMLYISMAGSTANMTSLTKTCPTSS